MQGPTVPQPTPSQGLVSITSVPSRTAIGGPTTLPIPARDTASAASSPPVPLPPCFSPQRSVTRMDSAPVCSPTAARVHIVEMSPKAVHGFGTPLVPAVAPQAMGPAQPNAAMTLGGVRSSCRGLEQDHQHRLQPSASTPTPIIASTSAGNAGGSCQCSDGVDQAGANLDSSPKFDGRGAWSVDMTVRLEAADEQKALVQRAVRIDKSSMSSVSNAIDQLSRGSMRCPDGLCIVFSSSAQAHFLLYRQDREGDVANAGLSVAPVGSSPCRQSSQVMSTPLLPKRCIRFESPTRSAAIKPATGAQPATPISTPKNSDMTTPKSRMSIAKPHDNACKSAVPSIPALQGFQGAGKCGSALDGKAAPVPMVPCVSLRTLQQGAESQGMQRDGGFFTPRSVKHSGLQMSPVGAPRRSLTLSPTARQCFQKEASSSPVGATFAAIGGDCPQQEKAKKPPSERSSEIFEIGNRRFHFLDMLGRGAFGVVWRAREQDSQEDIAVKVIHSSDAAGFAVATFEAELLQMLSAACSRMQGHVPRYISHSASRKPDPSAGGVIRLAMSYVPGGAFDKWMYGISDEDHKTVDIGELIDGHFPGSQQGVWELGGACAMARELLAQLSRVFSALQPIAYHRDVSAHNVLMHFPEGAPAPKFALIDFGLAVRSGTWSQKWRSSNLAGDPRYWTPTAWMAFAFGFKYVTMHPNSGFQQQYLTRMDHFSLGVMGLETLFALCGAQEVSQPSAPGMKEVRNAWAAYWAAVVNLFQLFHIRGPQEVRAFLGQANEGGVGDLVAHLRTLRSALRQAAVHQMNAHCAALLLVLADLVDERGSVTWEEIPTMLSEDLPDAQQLLHQRPEQVAIV